MKTKSILEAAVIAAIYCVLTLILAPISYGPMQIRISEALTVLPALTPAAIPGLFVGCLLANIIGPYGIADIVIGSTATLVAAYLSYKLRKKDWLVPLPPVLVNAVIIGAMLKYVYGVPMALPLCMLWVGLGQFVACYLLGVPLLKGLKKYTKIFKDEK